MARLARSVPRTCPQNDSPEACPALKGLFRPICSVWSRESRADPLPNKEVVYGLNSGNKNRLFAGGPPCIRSPLTDSNRRPPPYHARTRAITRDAVSPATRPDLGVRDESRDVARVVSDVSVLCPRSVVGSDNAAQEVTSTAFPAIVLAFVLTSSSFSFLVLIQGPGQTIADKPSSWKSRTAAERSFSRCSPRSRSSNQHGSSRAPWPATAAPVRRELIRAPRRRGGPGSCACRQPVVVEGRQGDGA